MNYTPGKDYTFPQTLAQLQNFTNNQFLPAQITIPSTLISERAQSANFKELIILFDCSFYTQIAQFQ